MTEKEKVYMSEYICFLYTPSIQTVLQMPTISGLYSVLIFMNSARVVIRRLHNKMNEQKREIKFEIFQLIVKNEGAAA